MRQVLIFDTTLRDGEKSPGTRLSSEEKVRVARQLARLKVDALEVGFPAASEEQYQIVRQIAQEIKGPVIVALARATNPRDFELAWDSIKSADRARLHTFVPGSGYYREHFLKKSAAEARELAVSAIKMAKKYTDDVEFSIVDTFRADRNDVVELVRAAVNAGAATINLADTVGYATPWDVTQLFQHLKQSVDNFDKVAFSLHAHNDLGLAVANSLAAISEGASQIHCTVNGIGERAGNTPLEELVAALISRASLLNVEVHLDLQQLYTTSRLVQRLTGISLQSHKPVVGQNAFIFEASVPQLSDAKGAPPYEVLNPEKLGIQPLKDALGADATLEDFRDRISMLGYQLDDDGIHACYRAFQELASRKEAVFDADLEVLAGEASGKELVHYRLLYLQVSAGSISVPNATVQMDVDGQILQDAGFGHGPVDAAFKTIFKMVKRHPKLLRYEVNAVTSGTDAQGEVTVRIEENGQVVNGRAVDTDIVLASAKALIDGLNKLKYFQQSPAISEFTDEESWMPKL